MVYDLQRNPFRQEALHTVKEMDRLTEEILELISLYQEMIEKNIDRVSQYVPHQEIYGKSELEDFVRFTGIASVQEEIEYKQQLLKSEVFRLYMYLGIQK